MEKNISFESTMETTIFMVAPQAIIKKYGNQELKILMPDKFF